MVRPFPEYAHRIIGWRVSRTAQAAFVLDALEQALHEWRPVQDGGLASSPSPLLDAENSGFG